VIHTLKISIKKEENRMAGDNMSEVTDGNFKQEVLESNIPVLVDFWAPWCMPCFMVAPAVEALARENVGKLKVVKLNTDESPSIASNYGVTGIPTLMLFDKGKDVERIVGARPKEQIMNIIESHLS
jgi:thioredoxin 1